MRAIALLILVISVNATFGQTASDLNASYSKSDSGYVVSKHIEMTADYSADGQVCRMRFSPRNIEGPTNNVTVQLPFPELKKALNEVVPPHLRGLKNDSFGSTSLGGGTALTTYGYDKVTFTFSFSYMLDVDGLKRAESFVLPLDESRAPRPEKTAPSLDDFAGSQKTRTEIVTISWNHRPCPPK